MNRVVCAVALALTLGSLAGKRADAGDGYFYAPPSYYAAPPVYAYGPVYAAPVPIVVAQPVVVPQVAYYYPPTVAYYYPPAVAYYPPAAYATSVRYRHGEIKVREQTPWGSRKYEWEYRGHGVWELDD